MIGSSILIKQMLGLGLKPRKTYNDDPFPNVPDAMMPHFVRGYLDGDGCISVTSKNVCGVSFVGSPKFIVGIHDNLVRLVGMRTHAIQLCGKKTKWSTVQWSSLEDLRLFYDFVYSGDHFCLERKKQKLVKWLSEPRWGRGHFFGNRSTGPLK